MHLHYFSLRSGVCRRNGSQHAQAQNASAQFVPFYSFLRIVENAAPTDYVGHPGSLVSDATAFASMREHIIDMYGDAHVANSYVLDEQIFDCIPIAEQPSVRLLGITGIASPPPPDAGPEGHVSTASVPQVGPEQKVDAFGNAIDAQTDIYRCVASRSRTEPLRTLKVSSRKDRTAPASLAWTRRSPPPISMRIPINT